MHAAIAAHFGPFFLEERLGTGLLRIGGGAGRTLTGIEDDGEMDEEEMVEKSVAQCLYSAHVCVTECRLHVDSLPRLCLRLTLSV